MLWGVWLPPNMLSSHRMAIKIMLILATSAAVIKMLSRHIKPLCLSAEYNPTNTANED